MANVEIRIDHDADAAYIRLSHEKVARTIEVGESVLVDLDEMGVAVGIEMLSLDAEIPFSEVRKHCHVHSDVVDAVRSIRPSISGFARLYLGSDGASSATADQRHTTDA